VKTEQLLIIVARSNGTGGGALAATAGVHVGGSRADDRRLSSASTAVQARAANAAAEAQRRVGGGLTHSRECCPSGACGRGGAGKAPAWAQLDHERMCVRQPARPGSAQVCARWETGPAGAWAMRRLGPLDLAFALPFRARIADWQYPRMFDPSSFRCCCFVLSPSFTIPLPLLLP
jgi:hypothetical protein